jgi:hypothetical protein
MHRTVDCLVDVGNHSVVPTAELVTEQPKVPGESRSNSPFRDNPSLGAMGVWNRRHFDHKAALRPFDLQGRVVEIMCSPSLPERHERLVRTSFQCTKWPPAPSGSQ